MSEISAVLQFLHCETPEQWLQQAVVSIDLLLIDHAHCEKKAASSALQLMYRYVDSFSLLQKLSRLAREELRHFEKVLSIIEKRGIKYRHLNSSGYAQALRQHVRAREPEKLIDSLIIGAIIEARSCERFAKIAPLLDDELQAFYVSLLHSEARHFEEYLDFAKQFSKQPIEDRVDFFLDVEKELILAEEGVFRFHSGVPVAAPSIE